jgi:pilus assembly protein Flp/PilA
MAAVLRTKLAGFFRHTGGATALEYALIAGVVSVCIVVSLKSTSGTLKSTFNTVGSNLTAAAK